MKSKLSLIRALLAKIVEDIDTGNSTIDDAQYEDILEQVSFFTQASTKYSKYQACKYLGISRSTFDGLVREGKLPPGKKQQGFKEIFWTRSTLDKYRSANQQ